MQKWLLKRFQNKQKGYKTFYECFVSFCILKKQLCTLGTLKEVKNL